MPSYRARGSLRALGSHRRGGQEWFGSLLRAAEPKEVRLQPEGLFGGHDGPLVLAWFDMKVGEYREPKDSCVACHEFSCVQLPLLIQKSASRLPRKSAKSHCLATLTGKRALCRNISDPLVRSTHRPPGAHGF